MQCLISKKYILVFRKRMEKLIIQLGLLVYKSLPQRTKSTGKELEHRFQFLLKIKLKLICQSLFREYTSKTTTATTTTTKDISQGLVGSCYTSLSCHNMMFLLKNIYVPHPPQKSLSMRKIEKDLIRS